MKLVIFGLTISSSWGNGHATLWRGLCRAMIRRGHEVIFCERDVPYYADNRDYSHLPGGSLLLYRDWAEIAEIARHHLREADVGMVTSYCPDGITAAELVLAETGGLRVFYDLDTPVTLDELQQNRTVGYLPAQGLGDFDLVLSYTGGSALAELKNRLGARQVMPLYGSVDPEAHRPVPPLPHYQADLSYIGTYAADRQATLNRLFVEPARRLRLLRFVIAGAKYPANFPWTDNIFFVRHLPPGEHPAFFCSSRITLNVTRRAMADLGYCPSGRLFEAAACGTPILSDWWPGLEDFFTPGAEILVAQNTDESIEALQSSPEQLQNVAAAARARVLAEHTSWHRVLELEGMVESVTSGECVG